MRTASPWWASLVFGIGLLVTFISERLLGHMTGMRVALTGIGVGLALAITVARAWTMSTSRGPGRRIEATLLACHVGSVIALCVYALTTKWGMNLVGVGEASAARFTGTLTVVWAVLMLASLVPVLMIELSLGIAMRDNFDVGGGETLGDGDEKVDAGVEYFRVRELGWSGLSIAFAAALLLVTCGVAKERNVQRDLSYFKTSSPGDSTKNIVRASTDVIKAHLFFPPVNEVKEHVVGYFEALAAATGKVEIVFHNYLLEPELAVKYGVQDQGYIVLTRGDKDDKFVTHKIDPDIDKARKSSGALRNLDREINKKLVELARDKRKAYLIAGHGEATSPESLPADLQKRLPPRPTSWFKGTGLPGLHYEAKDLGPRELMQDVPDDATMVILLAPMLQLERAEWDALDRYLARGGRLLVALDPQASPDLGPLEGRLGVRLANGAVTDDKEFVPRHRSITDRRFALTTQFSSHATTTALSRGQRPLYLINSGALEDVPFTGTGEAPKKTITIRTMESSWLDYNQNFAFDEGGPLPEKRQKWNVAAAIEGPKAGGSDGFRAIVVADVDMFVDAQGVDKRRGTVELTIPGLAVFVDSIRWLGGEEVFAGEIVSEDDKPIAHTKNEDAVWFTLTIIGVPVLVLSLGLFGTWFRRRRAARKTEVTP